MPQIPIFLAEQTDINSVERMISELQSRRYQTVSLRKLFLFLRGSVSLSSNACAVVLPIADERHLEILLASLCTCRMELILAVGQPLSAKMSETLLSLEHLTVISTYHFGDTIGSDAVFCHSIDTRLLSEMRKLGVRMVITAEQTPIAEIPYGMDVLSVCKMPASDKDSVPVEQTQTKRLPLDASPLFSALHLAIPLSIIGAEQDELQKTLSCDVWQACYVADEDRYTLTSAFSALCTELCKDIGDTWDTFCGCIQDGYYIELQTNIPIAETKSDRILLFGYDAHVKTFAAYTAMQYGSFDRVDILGRTVEALCCLDSTTVKLHRVAKDTFACSTERFVAELQSERPSQNGVFFGREAAVRYANRFYRRFADSDALLSADSLRMFLQERMRFGFALWYLASREDFYLQPFEEYLHQLAKLCKPAIEDLRGKTWLKPDMPLYLTSDMMRKLLHAEESCTTAFLDEWERASYRKAYLEGIKSKNEYS